MTSAVGTYRRDVQVIGIIGFVHMLSHFFQLSLAPLFPLIGRDLGVSNTELGLMISLFFIASGTLQAPAGFVVDRVGARPVLLAGLGLLSLSVAAYSLAPSYLFLAVLVVLAGAGNSVFHPADYSAINQSVNPKFVGRAYSVHGIGGHLGFALAPAVIAPLSVWFGWRGALAAVGLAGAAICLVLLLGGAGLLQGTADRDPGHRRKKEQSALSVLLQPSIFAFFVFFMLFAMAIIGLQNFTATALVIERGMSLLAANGAITAFLIAAPIGALAGGIVADRATRHHDVIATAGFVVAGILILLVPVLEIGGSALVATLATAGVLFGSTLPNRDMVIRKSTPPGSSGRVFGFIYCGLDIGAATTPTLYGFFLDLGRPSWIFFASGILLLLAALLVIATARFMAPKPVSPEPSAGPAS